MVRYQDKAVVVGVVITAVLRPQQANYITQWGKLHR